MHSSTRQQNRTRTRQLAIRLTDAEIAEVRAQAERRGMSLTRLLLEAVRFVSNLPYEGGFQDRPDANRLMSSANADDARS